VHSEVQNSLLSPRTMAVHSL